LLGPRYSKRAQREAKLFFTARLKTFLQNSDRRAAEFMYNVFCYVAQGGCGRALT